MTSLVLFGIIPLIEPYGIEIKFQPGTQNTCHTPLIEPYGIEIAHRTHLSICVEAL